MRPKLKILVADDDTAVRDCLCFCLTELGHDVCGVGGGVALLGACRAEPPDLVISDVQMPDLDGITATGTISRNIPVILLSGSWDEPTLERAACAGAAWCLTKPIRPQELQDVIRALRIPLNRPTA